MLDGATELHPFQGVGAGQLEHGATGPDEFVGERQLPQPDRGRPVGGRSVRRPTQFEFAHDFEEAERRIESLHRPHA